MAEQISLDLIPERQIFTVGQLNAAIRSLLDREFQDIWVAGEISGTKLAASGHYYFTLKEDSSQLRCVCFRMTARFLRFKPQDGVAVLARGRIDVYEARGEYQLLVEALEPQGYGALQLAFEQLKKKLSEEGLFDAGRKRPLPKLPGRIGIVTSPRGAVIRDMLQILARRFPGLHIRVYPALVQGDGAVEEVTRAIDYFSGSRWSDVVIVARGGGSIEDLWAFNEEAVARAIARCKVPVISAIGHETDFTIADFVADLRAPTPSAAAELVICTKEQLFERVDAARRKLEHALRYRLADAGRRLHQQGIGRASSVVQRMIGRSMQRVDDLVYRLRDLMRVKLDRQRRARRELDERLRKLDLRLRLAAWWRRLDPAAAALGKRIHLELERRQARLDSLSAQLTQLSPLRILERGYAIVQDEAGRVVKDAAAAPPGVEVGVRLATGRLRARVTESLTEKG
jgi:exodeoxyribonuclease VII large subunit